jgi:hypothetical protein
MKWLMEEIFFKVLYIFISVIMSALFVGTFFLIYIGLVVVIGSLSLPYWADMTLAYLALPVAVGIMYGICKTISNANSPKN